MRTGTLLLLCLAACGGRAPAGGSPAQRGAFARLVDEIFAAEQAWSPSDATAYGIHSHDRELEDRSRPRIEARIAELHRQQARLADVDRSALSFDDAIDARALDGMLAGELIRLEVIHGWEMNPMTYAGLPGQSVDLLMKRAFAPGPERVRAVIARLRKVPDLYAAGRANLRNPPRELTELAIRNSKGSALFLESSVPVWGREAAGGDRALLAELTAANAAALAATRELGAWLERDLLPRSTGNYAIGAETYAALLRADEMIETPLPELLAIGEAQLAKDHAAFIETAKLIDPKKSAVEVMKGLSADHPTAEELIPAVARSLEETRQFVIDKGLVTIPSDVRPRVLETPPYERDGGFASMSTPGAFEKNATEAFYYVTPVEKDWDATHVDEHLRLFNRTFMALIDIHEVFPGHYVQFLYAPRYPSKTRKLYGASSNFEGWAHYAEQMMIDEGFGGGDPRYRLAQLSGALVRDCRFVVGIKLHTAGMTVEQGTQLMVDQGFMERAVALEETRRGTYDATYLYYTLGKIEIQKLRDDYRKATGASLRAFHDAFIAQGPLPIPLMRRILLEKDQKR